MGPDSDAPTAAPIPDADDELTFEVLRRLAGRERPYARYQLEGEVAQGGQGAIIRVWDEDLRRHLAMKVILGEGDAAKAGQTPRTDSRTLGRFLEEAQVTGQLDHPGIVPVHELGLDSEGRVYFTMKLVKGRDLKAIFDLVHEEKEGWNQTRALNVMLKVCDAMAYAHSKGVIHRDLKPSNVMVGRYGEVFVMDWGLARVAGERESKDIRIQPGMTTSELRSERRDPPDAADSPLITMDGDVVGTPAYMSPEQALGRLEEMGPHSDVYSVGAMLYELLAGHMPYVKPGMRLTSHGVWYRVQEGPPDPLSEHAPAAPPELIAICDKAMAREAAHRYADTSELAEDLRAFLERRVVGAYETGAVAELRKWVARNKPLAAASAAAVLALVGGLAASSSLYVEAREKAQEASDAAARARANAAEASEQADLARAEAERATREEATTERVLDFLTGMFDEQNPNESRGATVTVKEVLDRNAARIERELEGEPEIKARLMEAMGSLYGALGRYQEAEPLLSGALELRRTTLGEDHLDTLGSLNVLAALYQQQGRHEDAEGLVVEVLEKYRAVLGEDHPDTLLAMSNLAVICASLGRYEQAESLYVQVLAKSDAVPGEDDPDTLNAMNSLAVLYGHLRHYEKAERLLVRVLEEYRTIFGENHPDTINALANLAVLYDHQGRYVEAEPLLLQALEESRAVLGEDHPDTINALGNLAVNYQSRRRYAEAEPLATRAFETCRAVLGEDHPETLRSAANLASLYGHLKRYEEAEALALQALETSRAVLGEEHPDTLLIQRNLAGIYRSWLTARRRAPGERHPDTLTVESRLGVFLWSLAHDDPEAERLLLDCLAKRTQVLGDGHAETLASLSDVARLHESLGRLEEAEIAAGMLLELTPEDADEYAEREQLLERIVEARRAGE